MRGGRVRPYSIVILRDGDRLDTRRHAGCPPVGGRRQELGTPRPWASVDIRPDWVCSDREVEEWVKLVRPRSSSRVHISLWSSGLFLALGGAAYAQSPATDQYSNDQVAGRPGLGDRRWRLRLGRRRVPGASEHRSFAPRRRRHRRRARRRGTRPPAARAAQELAGARKVTRPVAPLRGGSIGAPGRTRRFFLRRVPPGPGGAMQPSCADPSRPLLDTREARARDRRALQRHRRARSPARATRTSSASARRACDAPVDPLLCEQASRPGEECLVADEAPHREHAERRGDAERPPYGGPPSIGPRGRRSAATIPREPGSSAVSVRPTISQCQSRRWRPPHAR